MRSTFFIESSPETTIAVHHRERETSPYFSRPILLLHGARASSIPSFDLNIEGGSLAHDLEKRGLDVYMMDARNYGSSSRSSAMDEAPSANTPLSRSQDVVEDIRVVVERILEEKNLEQLVLMGWATGGQWLAHYAATHPSSASHLVLFNSLWPVAGPWPLGDALEDPDNPGHLREGALPGYSLADRQALLAKWESSIPAKSLDSWRDPSVAEQYATEAIACDPRSHEHSPPQLRVPTGALADSFLLSRGRRLFDPENIISRTLIVRSERDFWSREIDVDAPRRDLTNAASVDSIQLPDATHFAHLDQPNRGRDQMIETIAEFCLS
jgi:pimeloyl-ACP methyl ester carboxylesterase